MDVSNKSAYLKKKSLFMLCCFILCTVHISNNVLLIIGTNHFNSFCFAQVFDLLKFKVEVLIQGHKSKLFTIPETKKK